MGKNGLPDKSLGAQAQDLKVYILGKPQGVMLYLIMCHVVTGHVTKMGIKEDNLHLTYSYVPEIGWVKY